MIAVGFSLFIFLLLLSERLRVQKFLTPNEFGSRVKSPPFVHACPLHHLEQSAVLHTTECTEPVDVAHIHLHPFRFQLLQEVLYDIVVIDLINHIACGLLLRKASASCGCQSYHCLLKNY